jgi:hypothetical protein
MDEADDAIFSLEKMPYRYPLLSDDFKTCNYSIDYGTEFA